MEGGQPHPSVLGQIKAATIELSLLQTPKAVHTTTKVTGTDPWSL